MKPAVHSFAGGLCLLTVSCVGVEDDGLSPTEIAEPTEQVSSELSNGYMNVNEYLFAGQRLMAPNCYYRVSMQGDGNLVLYSGPGDSNPIWASNTAGHSYAYAVMQTDGNFVVRAKDGHAIWDSHRTHYPNSRLAMQDDGNLVTYRGSNATWATHTERAAHAWPCGNAPKTQVTFLEHNTDRPGSNIDSFTTTGTVSRCGAACAANVNCKAFTYVPSGIQDPVYAKCWLKSGVPAAVANTQGMITGLKKTL